MQYIALGHIDYHLAHADNGLIDFGLMIDEQMGQLEKKQFIERYCTHITTQYYLYANASAQILAAQ